MSKPDRLRPLFRGLLDYREEKRAGRPLPAKTEPTRWGWTRGPAAPDPDRMPGRAGLSLSAGQDRGLAPDRLPTGRLVADVLSGTYLDYILGMLEKLARRHRPVWSVSVFRWSENENLTTERLFLPLADGSDRLSFILGIQQFEFAPKGSVQPTWGVVTALGHHRVVAP